MIRLLRRFWPTTLRMRLLLVVLPVVGLPIIATGYVLEISSHQTFIEEKSGHLQGIDTLLAHYLDRQGGYGGLMEDYRGDGESREEKIRFINSRLRDFTDQVAESFPGVGVGYYHLGLNAIVTYGPSSQYDKTVGITIPPDHPGWQVMAGGVAMTESGDLVRGNIMNAMRPIRENGQVAGYIWANEFLDAIDRQSEAMRYAVQTMTLAGFALSIAVVFFIVALLTNDMKKIKKGLMALHFDLNNPIPPIRGEIGEIVEAINDLAKSLLAMKSMHNNILDSLADAVITVDSNNIVTYINPAGCELLDCRAAEVVGNHYPALLRPDTHFPSPLVDTLQTGAEHRGVEIDYPLPHRTLHVVASTGVLHDGLGQKLGVVAVIRDISEQYQLRRQIAQTERLAAVGEMAAGIAHELRTPLTSIRGFVQYLQGSSDPGEWEEYGGIIIREVDRLNRIVSALLGLVRPQPLHATPADINQLVRETLLLLTPNKSGGDARIRFVPELAENLPPVEVDSEQIKGVLLNLIDNGIQAIEDAGKIVIRTLAGTNETVSVSISDDGCGIPESIRERIFDPFFSTKPAGTGLGMAIARRIVESHHGTIEIDSKEGSGTTVTLHFRAQMPAHDATEPPSVSPSREGESVTGIPLSKQGWQARDPAVSDTSALGIPLTKEGWQSR
jgi:two-component system sensor histidine kinase AtoS